MNPISGSMNLHRVLAVRLVRYMPENSNAVTIRLESYDGLSDFDLTIFDLPTKHAEQLVSALTALHAAPVDEPEPV